MFGPPGNTLRCLKDQTYQDQIGEKFKWAKGEDREPQVLGCLFDSEHWTLVITFSDGEMYF